ncbi:MAG: NUDIX hydrolase [Desulfobacterales bacterium]|nr:NUDIX hydrolase [Desulfobacterales bacterium]MDJ0914085.1 NUDIX hydrolase [Desulfobacterales bacterium]
MNIGGLTTHDRRAYPDLPRVAVGAVVIKDGKVLLVKRGQHPAKDHWAIPGGSVHLGETLQAAAEREIREETGITIRAQEPVFTFDVIQHDDHGHIKFHYVIIDLKGEYVAGEPHPADDATDARWISPAEMQHLPVNTMTRRLLARQFGFHS